MIELKHKTFPMDEVKLADKLKEVYDALQANRKTGN